MLRFKPFLLLAAMPSVAIFASPALADEYIQVSTGIDYSSGDYGDTVDTDFLAIPVTVKYQAENFYLRASTSWLEILGTKKKGMKLLPPPRLGEPRRWLGYYRKN